MTIAELTLGFVLFVFRLELGEVDNTGDASGESGWEGGGGDDVFVGTLWLACNETDGGGRGGVQWVGNGDFRWL